MLDKNPPMLTRFRMVKLCAFRLTDCTVRSDNPITANIGFIWNANTAMIAEPAYPQYVGSILFTPQHTHVFIIGIAAINLINDNSVAFANNGKGKSWIDKVKHWAVPPVVDGDSMPVPYPIVKRYLTKLQIILL